MNYFMATNNGMRGANTADSGIGLGQSWAARNLEASELFKKQTSPLDLQNFTRYFWCLRCFPGEKTGDFPTWTFEDSHLAVSFEDELLESWNFVHFCHIENYG